MPIRTLPARLFAGLLVAVVLPLPALAQGGGPLGSLTATVADAATGETLPSATVALYAVRDTSFVTGAAADLEGAVRIDPVRPGTYFARISFVGYVTQRQAGVVVRANEATDLGRIELEPDAAELGEAEVTAQRELVEQRADRTVYNVAQQSVTAGGSALETLQTLPSIEVDASGNLALRGNQNVVIQINGRPVPVRGTFLAALLRQIPATNVERVAVIPNPSARYDPEGMSGIINIVLKDNSDRGLVGGVTVGGGSLPSGELGGNVSFQRGKIDVTSTYGFRYDRGLRDGSNLRRNLLTSTDLNQISIDENGSQSHFFNSQFDYTLNPGTTLGLQGTLGLRDGSSDNSVDYFDGPTTTTAVAGRTTEGSQDGFNGDLALVFRKRFDQQAAATGASAGGGGMMGGGRRMGGGGGPSSSGSGQGGHELSAEARFTRNGSTDDNLYGQTGVIPGQTAVAARERQTSDQTNDEAYAQVDYVRPVGELRLETGAKVIDRTVNSDLQFESEIGGTFTPDASRTNAFEYTEQITAAYLQGARSLGPFEAQVGLRAETASRDFSLLSALPEGSPTVNLDSTSYTYQSLFPSAFLTLPFSPGTLIKASYSRLIERPRTFFLNPFPNFDNPLSIRTGNPLLRPEYTDAFELTLQYKFFATLTPFYRRTTDVIQRSLTVDQATGVSRLSFDNFDTQESYGSDLTLFGQFGPVRGFVSGSVFRQVTAEGDASSGIAADAVAWTLRSSMQVKLREGTDLQFFGFFRGPQEFATGRISGFGFSTVGLTQKFGDDLTLNLRVNDPFSTTRFEFENTQGDVFRSFGVSDPAIRQISGTLTWTFGSGPQRRTQQPQQPQGGGGGFDF